MLLIVFIIGHVKKIKIIIKMVKYIFRQLICVQTLEVIVVKKLLEWVIVNIFFLRNKWIYSVNCIIIL